MDLLRRLRDARGAAMVELAIALIFLPLLVAGIWDLGRAYDAKLVATNAAREGARWAALGEDEAQVVDRVADYMGSGKVGRLDVSPETVEVGSAAADGASAGEPGAVVCVRVQVPVSLFFGGILGLGDTLTVGEKSSMRLQSSSSVGAADWCGPDNGSETPTNTPMAGPTEPTTETPVPTTIPIPTNTPVPTNTPRPWDCTCDKKTKVWSCSGGEPGTPTPVPDKPPCSK